MPTYKNPPLACSEPSPARTPTSTQFPTPQEAGTRGDSRGTRGGFAGLRFVHGNLFLILTIEPGASDSWKLVQLSHALSSSCF